MGLTDAEVGSESKIVVSLSGVTKRCAPQGTSLRGWANLSEQLWGFQCLTPFETEMLGRVMPYGLIFPRLQKPDNCCCRTVKVCLKFESSPLWNSTFLPCLERDSGFPALETISSFVLHHHVPKYWSECETLALRNMKSKDGLKWWMWVKHGERKLLWEHGAQAVKDTVVKLGRLVYKPLGQLACI